MRFRLEKFVLNREVFSEATLFLTLSNISLRSSNDFFQFCNETSAVFTLGFSAIVLK